jgi:hypothetical protein
MGDRIDAVKRITTDHERVEQLFVKYEGPTEPGAEPDIFDRQRTQLPTGCCGRGAGVH